MPANPTKRRLAVGSAGVLLAGTLVVGSAGTVSSPAATPLSGRVSADGAAQARARAAITLTAPATVAVGTTLRLTGRAVVRPRSGRGRPRRVNILEAVNSRWRVVARTWTRRTGAFAVRIPAGGARTRAFRAAAPALRGLRPAGTGTVRVKVAGTVGPSTGTAPRPGEVITPERLPAGYVAAGSASDWGYLFAGGGRWNPCETIQWSYNPFGQPYAGALADVSRAFAKISGVSGLRFQYVGRTGYRYLGAKSEIRFPTTTDIVVSWATSKEMPDLAGAVIGLGGSTGFRTRVPGADVDFEITRGHLTLDDRPGVPIRAGFGGRSWGQVMMHEILHALGLAHAKHADQLMYGTQSSKNFRFGAGDIRGMRRIGAAPGSSGCL
jgi:hypothetical protein